MKQKKFESLKALEEGVEGLRQLVKSKCHHKPVSIVLFRGQPDSNWELKTTLERYSSKIYSVDEYNSKLLIVAPVVSSYTEKDWAVTTQISMDEACFYPSNYAFMAYLRHHGFPSPLLDWTQSLYVALFFAYQSANGKDDISIYTYIESYNGSKSGWMNAPRICKLGADVKTHRRHFIQQGQYTVAVKFCDEKWVYCPHSEAFEQSEGMAQDMLCKFILPGHLKFEILAKLYEMNINAFTLYSSEESLMEMLAYKELTLRPFK